ncbi:MAG TPA: VOC family protein [Acidimicrobiales bacterium]
MAERQPRAGYRSVTPRIFVDDVAGQVRFLREVFDAAGEVEPVRPVDLRIGAAVVMVSSTAERDPFPAFLYVYDADAAFRRAAAAGAEVLEEPLDTPYGVRRAMVRDPFGNVFQIAHPLTGP